MRGISRRSFLTHCGAVAAGLMFGGVARGATKRCNMVVYMSDEHSFRYASIYGHPMVQTPNLDRMAARGAVFENCYTPSPLCLPARSAVMSGRRVHEIQTYNNSNAALEDYESYGAVLAKQGVYTAYIGKVDVYRPAKELGFSEMVDGGDRQWPGDENFVRVPLMIRKDAAKRANGFGPRENALKGDEKKIDKAVAWLKTKAPTLDAPWVLVVNTNAPHFPQHVTQELWDMYPDGGDLPKYGRDVASANHPYARDLRDHFECDLFSDDQIRGLRRGYLGCVTWVDRQIGRLMDALDETGLAENTVFAYTSDHGEMLGKFGMWWKCSLYEDSAHIPLVVMGPGFKKGTRVSTPVDTLDVQATLFECAGADRPEGWSGVPLQDIKPHDADRVVFSEYHGHGVRSGAFMIRKGDWKLIYCMKAPHLLFNLREDPDELNNLAESEPEKFKELEAELRKICSPEKENDRARAFNKTQLAAIEKGK